MPPPPPGYQGGPQMQQGPSYRRPRTRLWRLFGLVLLIGVVGFNVLIFLSMFAGGSLLMGGGNPHGLTEYSRKGGSTAKVAVIPVEGVILEDGGGGLFGGGVNPVALVQDGLRKAKNDPDVKAVVLEVNSPGGGVTASDTIHKAIRDFKEETGKPVVIYMKDLAASGGYYISAPADHIVANRTTLTGSIGVIIQGFNFHGTLTEVIKGEDATIKAGGNKAMGSMFADPESKDYKEGRALLQELADEMHATFKSVVKEGRGGKLSADWETYADGRVLSASQALKVGLIDEIGYFDDAVNAAETAANVSGTTVVEYGREAGLGALLGISAEEVERMEKAGAMAIEERMSARLQAQLRMYPGRPMAIWVP
jgi:protease-4